MGVSQINQNQILFLYWQSKKQKSDAHVRIEGIRKREGGREKLLKVKRSRLLIQYFLNGRKFKNTSHTGKSCAESDTNISVLIFNTETPLTQTDGIG
jgi:hypothetical protein